MGRAFKMKLMYSWLFALTTALFPYGSAQALSNGDSLEFFPAPNPESPSGSKFGMEVAPGFVLYTPIESENGIILGQVQPATGSHSGPPDGSETPDIDKPWAFFGNTGMHQTTVNPVIVVSDDGAGNFELDFTGWGVTWNGILNITLGGDPVAGDTGLATLTCSTPACTTGDSYLLDYEAHVPSGDPSGFGGVRYLLHLEGTVGVAPPPGLSVNIVIPGGASQECAIHGGTEVELIADASVPPGDEIESITWSVDGVAVGEGVSITPLLGLGNHLVAVVLETSNGLNAIDGDQVTVQDTTRPELVAEFVDAASGEVINAIDRRRRVSLHIEATDICDSAPEITEATVEKNDRVSVENGDIVIALPNGRTNIHNLGESLELRATARDASGNFSQASSILQIIE